jgi:Na+:H+ antiporter, NhaA family
LGLLVGKPLGIVLSTSAAVKAGVADNPEHAAPTQLVGIGLAAGIGFTVALFITELALPDPQDQSAAKLAILLASVLAAAISTVILRNGRRQTPEKS